MYPYHHVRTEDGRESLTVFMPEGAPVVATGDHPHFAQLLEAAGSDVSADELRGLCDLSDAVAKHFEQLSERVSVANGRVYFDGDQVDSTITQQIKRCLEDPTLGDWKPLVLFMENVAANPDPHSREQLFDWLRDRDFTITASGSFIGYKGVHDADDGAAYPYISATGGEAIVNGETFNGQIPNGPGATVEMPRSAVQHDPSRGCSTGLHVGTYKYAQTYARGALLTVLVNPRDVVSVPTDCDAEKMRVCRYVVQDDEATHPSESPALAPAAPRRIYKGDVGTLTGRYFAATGEYKPAEKDGYYLLLDSVNQARPGGESWRPARTVLEPTEPRHGDELIDAGFVEFYLACPSTESDYDQPRWVDALGRTQAEFLSEHEECVA